MVSGLRAAWWVWLLVACMPLAAREMPAQGSVEVAFSPADDPEALIVDVIGNAQTSLLMHAYVLTSRNIMRALLRAHERGVRVEILADAKMNHLDRSKVIGALLEEGVPVAFETAYAAAHNKVLIIDAGQEGCTVLTGSYNFTWSARNRNAENVLVLRNNCSLVEAYRDNWQRHRAEATLITQLPFEVD